MQAMMDLAESRSSSNELSSAPNSDTDTPNSHPPTNASLLHPGNRTDALRISPATNNSSSAASSATLSLTGASQRQDTPPVKVRKPRKKKDPAAPGADKKEKLPRKPRTSSTTATAVRKKPKLEAVENPNSNRHTAAAADLRSSKLVQPLSFPAHVAPDRLPDEAAKYSQNGFSRDDNSMRPHSHDQQQQHQHQYITNPQPQASTLRSSAIYDPVRSAAVQRPPEPTQSTLHSNYNQTPPRPTYGPSASPSISSIIDPPVQSQSSASTPLRSYPSGDGAATLGSASDFNANRSLTTMEVDPPISDSLDLKKIPVIKKSSSEAPTRATSPKPARAKEQPPPIPPGSGLLSASLFGGESADFSQNATEKGPNIVLHIDLKNPKNQVINFARMAEEKYGFAALYPRQAAQKDRLARVAAAGAALERSASGSKFGGTSAGESGDDDVSVDIDRDSDNDGDVAMSGLNGAQEPGNSGTDGPGPKRRRRRKMEEYDQDDPFVDDSEMLWEAQAAASKDGFFVYCGPLVPEGEKPAVERADGTVKRGRGRGRGGGPGSRGGRGGATSEGGTGRGGGPGSRGGGVTRKPRMKKAERLLHEQEKLAREKVAPLAAKPSA